MFLVQSLPYIVICSFRERSKQRAWNWENGPVGGIYLCDLFGRWKMTWQEIKVLTLFKSFVLWIGSWERSERKITSSINLKGRLCGSLKINNGNFIFLPFTRVVSWFLVGFWIVWCVLVYYGVVCCIMVWSGAIWFSLVYYGVVLCILVGSDDIWFGLVQDGVVWYIMV